MNKNKVFIIAEAGVNHNGSIELAKRLIDVAVESGADAVKFQTFRANALVCASAEKAEYQKKSSVASESQFQMLKNLELDRTDHKILIDYCRFKNIQFLSTPFDSHSIEMLNDFGVPIFKIPSGEITNLPYLEHIGRLNRDVILSTGMAELFEIAQALDVLAAAGLKRDRITVLHATTEYPCPIDEVNLRAMESIKKAFDVKIGYSDHTLGIEVSLAAVALGACVIEKHFTLDRFLDGPDHKASIEPNELKAMVCAIRNIEQALGNGVKKPSQSELKNVGVARKSLVASVDIKKGEIFSEKNICAKRPGYGVSPMRWHDVIGQTAHRDYLVDEQIEL